MDVELDGSLVLDTASSEPHTGMQGGQDEIKAGGETQPPSGTPGDKGSPMPATGDVQQLHHTESNEKTNNTTLTNPIVIPQQSEANVQLHDEEMQMETHLERTESSESKDSVPDVSEEGSYQNTEDHSPRSDDQESGPNRFVHPEVKTSMSNYSTSSTISRSTIFSLPGDLKEEERLKVVFNMLMEATEDEKNMLTTTMEGSSDGRRGSFIPGYVGWNHDLQTTGSPKKKKVPTATLR